MTMMTIIMMMMMMTVMTAMMMMNYGEGGGGVRAARQRMSDHIMVREEVRTQNHKMMSTRNVIDVSDFHDPCL